MRILYIDFIYEGFTAYTLKHVCVQYCSVYAMNDKMLRQMRGLTITRFLARLQLERKLNEYRDNLRSMYF